MKTITFYSYKGGVGRSLALVNIATRLAEFGKSVCIIDFDLEAPGLNIKFNKRNKWEIKGGIVDYIYDFYQSGNIAKGINHYALPLNLSGSSTKSSYLIPAGNIDSSDYWRKLSALNLYDLIYQNDAGIPFFLDLKEKIEATLKPDFLLIDSRTGISEIGGITLSLLADKVVAIAANNKENLNGISKVIQGISQKQESFFGNKPDLIFVLSRIPFTESAEDKAKEALLLSQIKNQYLEDFSGPINTIHSDRELEIDEKIKIGYEIKGINVPQISRDYLLLFGDITKDCLTEGEVQVFNQLKEAERLWSRANQIQISDTEKLSLLSRAIELAPTNTNYLLARAELHSTLGEHENALTDADTISEQNPSSPLPYILKGIIYSRKKENELAVFNYEKSLGFEPNNWPALTGLGLTYGRLNLLSKSYEAYMQLYKIGERDSVVLNGIANTLKNMDRLPEALSFAYQAISADPNFSFSHATLAEIKAATGDFEEFLLHLERAFILAKESNGPRALKELEDSLREETIYKQFVSNERLKTLLERYSIELFKDPLL